MKIKIGFILLFFAFLLTSCSKEKQNHFNQYLDNFDVIETEKTIDDGENYTFETPSDWYLTMFEQRNNINFEHAYS